MITLFGGLGMFLFGMLVMTEGLKSFAGDRLKSAMMRFTDRPIRAFFAGMVMTALVQSSSATTLATIGFVSAGILPFAQSVGIVFGASVGTTGTSWLVSVVGLKFSLSAVALPLVTAGVLLRIVGKKRWKELGNGLAGFSLMFVGISYMQSGMDNFTEYFDPTQFPVSGLGGHLILVGIGFLMTMVTQASSAAVAITLTALGSGVLVMEQAACLVIGQAVGTTMTALIAGFGASSAAKRTALAHVLFNVFSGIVAVIFLPLFLRGLNWLGEKGWIDSEPMSLAAFHTGFLLVGAMIFLPLSKPFTRMIEAIIKEPKDTLTGNLDRSLLTLPSLALDALSVSLRKTYQELLTVMRKGVDSAFDDMEYYMAQRTRILKALSRQQDFLAEITVDAESQEGVKQRLFMLHTIDHLERLASRLCPAYGVSKSLREGKLLDTQNLLRDCMSTALAVTDEKESWSETLAWIKRQAKLLEREKDARRPLLMSETASGAMKPDQTLDILDAIRWASKVTYHLWRIQNYLYPIRDDATQNAEATVVEE